MAPVSTPSVTHAKLPIGLTDKWKYIKGELKHKISMSTAQRPPTFLRIESYAHMEELFWKNDHHNYIHEGSRVDCSALLKMHCYTSARLQEICKARYKGELNSSERIALDVILGRSQLSILSFCSGIVIRWVLFSVESSYRTVHALQWAEMLNI